MIICNCMKPLTNLRLALSLLLAIAGQCVESRADDWPLVRGDIVGSGVAHTKLPDVPELLWKYSAGGDAGFDATAVIDNGIRRMETAGSVTIDLL